MARSASKGIFPRSGIVDGHIITHPNGKRYQWNSSKGVWKLKSTMIDDSNFIGPQGIQGPPGATGNTGATGPAGTVSNSVDGVGRGGNDILLLVGQGGNGSIRVRHIEGKDSPSDSPSGLYLNHYGPGEVSMCNGGGSVGIGIAPNERLTVGGNTVATGHIYANNKSQIITSPWYNFANNTGGSARLSTPIVHNESNMFYIKVTGFGYGSGGRNQEYLFSGYAYSGSTLIAQGANTTTGSNGCSIGTEVRNGTTYIYIQISNGAQYYNHYKFEYTGWGAKNVQDFNWSKV